MRYAYNELEVMTPEQLADAEREIFLDNVRKANERTKREVVDRIYNSQRKGA